jgi:hypothetical protein
MNKGATDHVLTIVRLLAKGADDSRLSPNEVDLLNQNVTALIQQERDDLVRAFLAAVKEAEGVIPQEGFCRGETPRFSSARCEQEA